MAVTRRLVWYSNGSEFERQKIESFFCLWSQPRHWAVTSFFAALKSAYMLKYRNMYFSLLNPSPIYQVLYSLKLLGSLQLISKLHAKFHHSPKFWLGRRIRKTQNRPSGVRYSDHCIYQMCRVVVIEGGQAIDSEVLRRREDASIRRKRSGNVFKGNTTEKTNNHNFKYFFLFKLILKEIT